MQSPNKVLCERIDNIYKISMTAQNQNLIPSLDLTLRDFGQELDLGLSMFCYLDFGLEL